jgi:hypothetical protein
MKFGGILFTPVRLTAVACHASGPLKVMLSFRSQNVPPLPPKPLHKHQYIRRHLVTTHFSQLTNMVLTLLALTIVCPGVHCGLKYQRWPMKWTLVVDQKCCQWRTVPNERECSQQHNLFRKMLYSNKWNYMFWPRLAIIRFPQWLRRGYIICVRACWWRDLYVSVPYSLWYLVWIAYI